MAQRLGFCVGVLAALGALNVAFAAGAAQPAAAPPLYAFCVELGAPGLKPRPLEEQAALLKELGFDGGGYPLWFGDELDKNLATLDQAGLKAYLFHTQINLKTPEKPFDPRLPDALAKLKGRPATISVLLVGLPAGDPAGMAPAVKALRELGDLAAKSDLRISIYNHVNNWTESLPFVMEVVKKADHPRVGANFNLCHWLKVDGQRDYCPLLRDNAAKLFAVTINGAQVGASGWSGGLIQPLDRGDFDNRQLLATLREIGYRGPIGLMCYGIADDARAHLGRSRKVWRSWHAAPPAGD
jgi:sugar phosphate isomerase/epimerase